MASETVGTISFSVNSGRSFCEERKHAKGAVYLSLITTYFLSVKLLFNFAPFAYLLLILIL